MAVKAIEAKDLRFTYPDGSAALRDVSFGVEEGECVGIIGPNGAGKSTLLLHLNGILPEDLGEKSSINVFGKPVTRRSLRETRRAVGLVFQDPDDQLFCPTVFEDVAFGPDQLGMSQKEIEARVKECLKRVGLEGFEGRSPQHLSGGEKRRVCLAGVLACDSRLLVLDEPTSNLDPRGRREFKKLLRELETTKLLATHDLDMVAELCSRVILLDGGRVVADGLATELLSDEPLMLAHGLEVPLSLKYLTRTACPVG